MAKDMCAAPTKRSEVKKSLAALPANEHFGLGPSREFHDIVKLVEKLEKEPRDSPMPMKARTPQTLERSAAVLARGRLD
jgi:hypothetical protein